MIMNENPNRIPRREFLGEKLGLGGLVAWAGGRVAAAHGGGASPRPGRVLGPEFQYNIGSASRTDPRQVIYEETARHPAGLKEPRRIAVDGQDRLHVVGDRHWVVLDRGGREISRHELADSPRCVAAAGDGTIGIGYRDRIEMLDGAGRSQSGWEGLGDRAVLTSIALTDEDVLAADAGNRLIWRFDRAGKLRGQIGKKDPARGVPGFVIPSPYFDIAVTHDGIIWAANPGQHRVEAYTIEGGFELGWGEYSSGVEGFCGCCNPINFALLPDGSFVTCEKGLVRVKVYSARGKFQGVVAGPEAFPGYRDAAANPVGLDVACDSGGRVLVVDPLAAEVRVFTRKSNG